MNNKATLVLLHSIPLVLGIFLSYFLWRSNMLLLIAYLVATAVVIVSGKDRRTESMVFIYGMVVGFIIETVGTSVSGYQSFANPDMLGIPLWLVVTWGYGFVLMKRVGLIIGTGSPWVKMS